MEQDEATQQRSRAIESIESTISELGQLFSQLTHLVAAQRETVQRIDADVFDIGENVSGAQTELLKFYNHVRSNRGMMLKIFAVRSADVDPDRTRERLTWSGLASFSLHSFSYSPSSRDPSLSLLIWTLDRSGIDSRSCCQTFFDIHTCMLAIYLQRNFCSYTLRLTLVLCSLI